MHQCLYCSKLCIETTIFCDECRASLLKHQHPSGAARAEHVTQPAWVYEQPATTLTEDGVDTSAEKPAIPLPTQSACKPLPVRPRLILTVFIMLAAISLVTGGILLAANILHTISLSNMAAIPGTGIVLSPQVGSTTWPGKTHTPAVSPVAGTPVPTSTSGIIGANTGTGTGTSTTTPGTATPAPGAGTPTPTSTPTTTIPCVLQAAPTHLSFTVTPLQPNPPGQSIMLKTTGNCGKLVTWRATADFSWIQLSSSTGSDNGSGSAVTVYARSNNIIGVYTAHITFKAFDSNGIPVQSSPQTISVTLTVIG